MFHGHPLNFLSRKSLTILLTTYTYRATREYVDRKVNHATRTRTRASGCLKQSRAISVTSRVRESQTGKTGVEESLLRAVCLGEARLIDCHASFHWDVRSPAGRHASVSPPARLLASMRGKQNGIGDDKEQGSASEQGKQEMRSGNSSSR